MNSVTHNSLHRSWQPQRSLMTPAAWAGMLLELHGGNVLQALAATPRTEQFQHVRKLLFRLMYDTLVHTTATPESHV